MNQEEEEEVTADNNLPSPGSDISDNTSYSYLTAASLSPILEESPDSSTPTREELGLLTPLRQSTTPPRSAKPLKRKQKYLSSREEAEPEAKLDHNNSALSGSSSGDSTDSAITSFDSYLAGHQIKSIVSKETTNNDPEDTNTKGNDDNDKEIDPPDPPDNPSIPTMPPKVVPTTPTVPVSATVDKDLEHLLVTIMSLKLADNVALALHRQGCHNFEDFCLLDELDTDGLQYDMMNSLSSSITPETCNSTDRKKIKRAVAYCAFRDDNPSDADRHSPTAWVATEYRTWCRNGYPTWLIANASTTTAPVITSPGPGAISLPKTQLEKDADALLVSWNRRPRDIVKYPHLKDDVGYKDWILKMKGN